MDAQSAAILQSQVLSLAYTEKELQKIERLLSQHLEKHSYIDRNSKIIYVIYDLFMQFGLDSTRSTLEEYVM